MLHPKVFFVVALLFLNSCQLSHIKKDTTYAQNNWQEVIDYANQNLSQEGYLVQQENGYAYVKVTDAYIHELFPLLKVEELGYKKPPYFRRNNAPGAHVSLFYEDEKVKIKEVGQKFSFTLTNIATVHINKSTSYIVLQIHAPALENLRKSYGLLAKLKGHEFHISLAKKQI